MQYRILGKTGLRISVIGFGGIPIQRVSEPEAVAVVNKALDMGINFFDTARGYTDSEVKLGQALRDRRNEAIIATKSMARTKEGMAADIDKSLQDLGVEYIDLYQLHNVKEKSALEQVFSPDGAMEALREAKKAGKIKHIGITGHIHELLKEAIKHDELETVQFPFNAVEAAVGEELLDLAKKANVGVIIMKPLAGGALTKPDLALKFILNYPVDSVIPGMDSLEQVTANAKIGDADPKLTNEEIQVLDQEVNLLGTTFCRRCEYCQPCPQDVNIPAMFLLDGYYTRYDLKGWARERYGVMPTKAEACIECGICEEKCPYDLPIRQMLKELHSRLG